MRGRDDLWSLVRLDSASRPSTAAGATVILNGSGDLADDDGSSLSLRRRQGARVLGRGGEPLAERDLAAGLVFYATPSSGSG